MPRSVTCHNSNAQSPCSNIVGPRDRTSGWRILRRAILLLFGLAVSQSCLAAENQFELLPKWVRLGPADTIVRVKLSDKIDVSKKMFLRFTLLNPTNNAISAITELPLSGDQLSKRVAEVKIRGPMRSGTYHTELVSEAGAPVAFGPNDFKVAFSEKPVITAIMPKVIYPKSGRYDFEIIGDNFNHFDAEKIVLRINDVELGDIKKYDSGKSLPPPDQRTLPYLVSDWRAIRIYGLSLAKVDIGRPLEISVEVDKLISDPKPLALSLVQRFMPKVIAIVLLVAVVMLVYFLFIKKMACSQPKKTPISKLKFLIIDPQTNTYSLSKLQMIIWAAAAIVAYSYLAASQILVQWKLGIPNVPEGLPMLLGISASTTALAVGATEFRGSKGAGMVHPGLADFITTGGVFAPERLQFFVWTILGAITFVIATLAQDPGTATEMANIPNTFNQLMGASSLGYLAGKFARKPGPVIKTVAPGGLSGGYNVVGENLSPRAQVMLNDGSWLSPEQVTIASGQTEGEEFVSELNIVMSGIDKVVKVKVKNPDGQLAEWHPLADEPASDKQVKT